MAIIAWGYTRCPLCEELLLETDLLVATSHFMNDPFHDLYRFSDAAMHRSCFLEWDKRQEFVQLFNEIAEARQFEGDAYDQMLADGEVISLMPVGPAMSQLRERVRMPMHDAAETGSVEEVVRLIQEDADRVNAPDEAGVTPLHLAVAYNGPDVIEALLTRGADISAKADTGQTVIHAACIQGRIEVLRLLLSSGSDVHVRAKSGQTPLHWAAATSSSEIVKALLAAGADVEANDNSRLTPLHEAVSHGQQEVVQTLLEAGANIQAYDAHGQTALHKAVAGGSVLLLRLLLSFGADPTAKDVEGQTPRRIAETVGNTMAMRLLDHTYKDRGRVTDGG